MQCWNFNIVAIWCLFELCNNCWRLIASPGKSQQNSLVVFLSLTSSNFEQIGSLGKNGRTLPRNGLRTVIHVLVQ
jgi:hypothetical protein